MTAGAVSPARSLTKGWHDETGTDAGRGSRFGDAVAAGNTDVYGPAGGARGIVLTRCATGDNRDGQLRRRGDVRALPSAQPAAVLAHTACQDLSRESEDRA